MAKTNGLPPKLYCCGCGRLLDVKEFYENHEPHHLYQRMYYCKDCCKTISADIMSRNANFELCTRNLCIVFDMPFTYDAMRQFEARINSGTKDRDVSYLYQYLRSLEEVDTPKEYWGDLSGASYFGIDLLKVAKPTSEGDIETLLQLEKEWGKQDTLYDYMFLEERYSEYSKGEDLSPSMRNTMKYLCLTELDIKKMKSSKGDNDTSKLEDKVQKYYKTLGLDKFQFKENKSEGQRTLEYFINLEEQTHPLEVADEMFKDDITGLKKEYKEMMRCIRNAKDGEKIFPEDYGI
ncbi:MAG: hypothetical protein MJZ20_10855 [Bacteroidaceae bacterium]|nr:hypothetical protein [Bacteroidaceae bacterium]